MRICSDSLHKSSQLVSKLNLRILLEPSATSWLVTNVDCFIKSCLVWSCLILVRMTSITFGICHLLTHLLQIVIIATEYQGEPTVLSQLQGMILDLVKGDDHLAGHIVNFCYLFRLCIHCVHIFLSG